MSASQRPLRPPEPKEHVHFELPPAFQTFTLFSRLPLELRDEIWESTVSDPGVHWLRLEHREMNFWAIQPVFAASSASNLFSKEEEDDKIKHECASERPPFDAEAVLAHPENQLVDKSWHLHVDKQMAAMSATNQLAREHVERMLKRADINQVTRNREGSRRFLVLDASRDLAFIEYLPVHRYQSDCMLRVFFEAEHFSKFRNVAVKYHPDWHVDADAASCCPQCGRFHGTTRAILPRHLYHFLARTFPNLETVWLVDYMMVQKNTPMECHIDCKHDCEGVPGRGRQRLSNHGSRQHQASATTTAPRGRPRSFRATDRIFYEATHESWIIKDRVSRIKDWLQDAYIQYAKQSKYACHESPETVKFGILGCRHNDMLPATRSSPSTQTKRKKRRADGDPAVARKSRRKLSLSSDQGIFTFYFDKPFDIDQLNGLRMHYFGSGTLNAFDFAFEMGKLSLGD